MKLSSVIRIFIKTVLSPIISVFLLDKFNLFEYFTFVPDNYKLQFGLTLYLAILEALFIGVEKYIYQKQAKITCIFYKTEEDKSLNNTPVLLCDDSSNGVTYLWCYIKLEGNLKKLRKCKFSLSLPEWLTTQAMSDDVVMDYKEDKIEWSFKKFLPNSGEKNQSAEYKHRIPFINNDDKASKIRLTPNLAGKWGNWGILFETNSFRIQNRK